MRRTQTTLIAGAKFGLMRALMSDELILRPYELLCVICARGRNHTAGGDQRFAAIADRIRSNPDLPVTLRCQVGGLFLFQDLPADNLSAFDERRDLEILHKLNLTPGSVLPARILFARVFAQIKSVTGICGYPSVTGSAWLGCPFAGTGHYAAGCDQGISSLITPRPQGELQQAKTDSLSAMEQAEVIPVRPHMLLCAFCQYGNGIRPPFPEDNLPELLALILKKPDIRISMARHADEMMCGPCPSRCPSLNACVNNQGVGELPNQLRDLRVLQKLGLAYGDTLPAHELYQRILERISGTLEICRLDHAAPSVWATGCGAATTDSEAYARGRQAFQSALEKSRARSV